MLQKGVNVNDTCQFSQFGTPLTFAMSLRRYDIVERLLAHHADLNMTDQNGKTVKELLLMYNDDKLVKLVKSYEK
jgi:ankyrin repeat protein